jgi:hypothetical protein
MIDAGKVMVIITLSALGTITIISVLNHCCRGWIQRMTMRKQYKSLVYDYDDDVTVSEIDV